MWWSPSKLRSQIWGDNPCCTHYNPWLDCLRPLRMKPTCLRHSYQIWLPCWVLFLPWSNIPSTYARFLLFKKLFFSYNMFEMEDALSQILSISLPDSLLHHFPPEKRRYPRIQVKPSWQVTVRLSTFLLIGNGWGNVIEGKKCSKSRQKTQGELLGPLLGVIQEHQTMQW